jgi:hypothetical protein
MRPAFVVIGAPRCGTTWLFQTLRTHPELDVVNEAHVFNSPRFATEAPALAERGLGPRRLGDITPNYFVSEEAPRRIADVLGADTLLVLCVREPVARAFSHYRFRRQRGIERRSFEQLVQEAIRGQPDSPIITASYYGSNTARFLDVFDRQRLLVVELDSPSSSPGEALGEICRHLRVGEQEWETQSSGARTNAARDYRITAAAKILNPAERWSRQRSRLVKAPVGLAIRAMETTPAPIPARAAELLQRHLSPEMRMFRDVTGYDAAWARQF